MVETTEASIATGEVPAQARPVGWGRVLRWTATLFVLGLIALLGWGVVKANSGQRQKGPAPDFSLQTFDGQTISLSQFRGQVVVINFWASWCIPCRQEANYLESTWRKYRDRSVVFIGLNWVDTDRAARAFLDEFHITYYNGVDRAQKIAQAYRMQGIPETFFVDRSGNLQGVQIGVFQAGQLDQKLDALLSQ